MIQDDSGVSAGETITRRPGGFFPFGRYAGPIDKFPGT